MDAENSSCLTASGAGLTPKTRRVSHKFFWKIDNRQNFLAVQVRQWHFGGRHEEKFAVFQAVHVGFELRQLSRADHAITPDQKWRAHFGVAVLARVQVDHEIDQCPFQFRSGAGETDESASA